MNSIANVCAALHKIHKAMWEGSGDPFQRPKIYSNGKTETITRDERSRLMIECDEVSDYPDYLEAELLRGLDREIGPEKRRDEIDGTREAEVVQPEGRGVDALAWYVSFHTSPGTWGIFIPTSSLIYLEQRVFTMSHLPRAARLQAGFDLLLEHELFHFATDYVCAQWEILMQTRCWSFHAKQRLAKSGTYASRLEEALANAYMLRTLEPQWGKRLSKSVRRFVGRQPPGYRDAPDYVAEDDFNMGLDDLAKMYVGLPAINRDLDVYSPFGLHLMFPVRPAVPSGQCPIHIIHDLGRFQIPEIAVRSYPPPREILETDKFKKMLVSVPHHILNKWNHKKEMSRQVGFPRHPEFQNFKDYFSLRVGLNFRAHLRHVSGADHDWEAFAIGPHKKMGHG